MTHLHLAGIAALALAGMFFSWPAPRQSDVALAIPAHGQAASPIWVAQVVTLPKCQPGQIC